MRDAPRGTGVAWAGSVLAVVCAAIALVYMAIGGLDYPAFATASWFITLAIVMGALMVVACLWNLWAMLTRIVGRGPLGPLMEPAWLGASISAALAVALGIVVYRIPSTGLASNLVVCPRGSRCYVSFGSSRTELGVATILFLIDALLFAAVGLWATRVTSDSSPVGS